MAASIGLVEARVKDAEEALKAQFKRTNDAYADAIVNPDLKQDEDDQIEALMKKAREAKDQTMGKLMKVLDDNQPAVQGLNQGPPAKRSMRIEEVLKPKDPLCESMTLEEVEHWLKGYEAFMDHNKEVLTQEGIKVSRAILDKCLDPKLSTRLRNIQNENGENMVKDDTPIQDCLKVLKNMFLEAIPLWLRRLNYFNCSQNENENVAQFWARKRDLASQCNLADLVVPDDFEVMELIRNVHAPQLRTKFLEVKDPKVPELLQIAANWQRAKDVSKSMERPQ